MANTVIIKNRSNTSSPDPSTSDLTSGEIAINYHAEVCKIYCKDSSNTIRTFVDANAVTDEATSLAIALG